MLRTPAPYPNVGSWALLEEPGGTKAVRILERDGEEALISIAGEFVASANRRLPVAGLANADALTIDEAVELLAIETRIAGRARPRKADVERESALRHRLIRAEQLQQILAKIPARHFPAAAEARSAA